MVKIANLLAALVLCWLPVELTDHEPGVLHSQRQVILLHGLARSGLSMAMLQGELSGRGYYTCNIDYPSREHEIATLAREYVLPALKACSFDTNRQLNFVTHSMGGIVLRYLARHRLVETIGRVVMLSPPNGGSEVVDTLGNLKLFEWINGPAGLQLGTDGNSLPATLGDATFELGVITGNRSINWVLSSMIEGVDDGKVSVQSAQLDGMADFLVLSATHPFIMKNRRAISQTVYFLEHGMFDATSE